jgi:uncharacterized protein YbjT (DUF2867 family)
MKVAITGGTGFVGRHVARQLLVEGHEVVLIARGVDRRDASLHRAVGVHVAAMSLDDESALAGAMKGCDAVVHCAGINRELAGQTYARVHVLVTKNVVAAAREAGVGKLVMVSFLRARPNCGSGYHESKWAAEEIVRGSGLDFTIVKAGVIYGRGDHMLDHLSHAFHTFPIFPLVGLKDQPVRPLAVEDLVRVLLAALTDSRLSGATVAATGPEQLTLREAVGRVASVVGRTPPMFPLPVWCHKVLAHLFELTMRVPLVSSAQVRILSEGIVEPLPFASTLPPDLAPRLAFTDEQIRAGLPPAGRFTRGDLRCCASARSM